MDVTLPPDLERFVDYLVNKGEYDSPEEVVRAGVARLRCNDDDLGAERVRIRGLIQVGIDDADAGRLRDGNEVIAEIRARYASLVENEAA